ncbi:hypothetical protein GOP47_0016596 [Adiantum capillus-veneris]|uniref:X8 domain-containing protein n=1 Tax=Adiantum capillus-veneris TaxID=13818 RepID=A0A9D4UIZ4_ADICA|nr:hypothetical protein GOP47_0016596 [Adiantum capillus-veneris]
MEAIAIAEEASRTASISRARDVSSAPFVLIFITDQATSFGPFTRQRGSSLEGISMGRLDFQNLKRFKLQLCSSCCFVLLSWLLFLGKTTNGLGVNWGTQASHRLPPTVVVQMLKDNRIDEVKLFDSDPETLSALAGSGIEVMLGIPNSLLQAMTDAGQAAAWVQKYVVRYIFNGGVNIKYVAVGNEPFLRTYNGSFINLTFPALRNIQNALNAANLGDQIKTTVPSNADVLADAQLPSQGTFRSDIFVQMMQIVQFLHQNGCPFTVNIYPFISLYDDSNFPADYAFFNGNGASVTDGPKVYKNVFDASYDTLVAALEHAGFADMDIIVGEIGWPTDGFIAATRQNAQKFNQGFLNHVLSNAGTPSRPNSVIKFYLFSLLDEDQKSIEPGNFERHWGIFQYNGVAKYPLSLPGSANAALASAQGVEYLQQRWCVLAENADLAILGKSINYACTYSDCTSLGYGSSCNPYLDTKGNASYAFNQYFQINNQSSGTCYFDGLGSITYKNPSIQTCQFIVQLAVGSFGNKSMHLSRLIRLMLWSLISALVLQRS